VLKKGKEDGEKLQARGKRPQWLFPHSSSRYSCCGRRGLSRGVARLFVVALVVEIRPDARAVHEVVIGSTINLCALAGGVCNCIRLYRLRFCNYISTAYTLAAWSGYENKLRSRLSFQVSFYPSFQVFLAKGLAKGRLTLNATMFFFHVCCRVFFFQESLIAFVLSRTWRCCRV